MPTRSDDQSHSRETVGAAHLHMTPLLHLPALLWVHIPQDRFLRFGIDTFWTGLWDGQAEPEADVVDDAPCPEAQDHEPDEQSEEGDEEAEGDRVAGVELGLDRLAGGCLGRPTGGTARG